MVTSKFKRGVRFLGGTLKQTQEAIQEDSYRSEEEVTMNLITDVANSIFKYLKFTHELVEGDQ